MCSEMWNYIDEEHFTSFSQDLQMFPPKPNETGPKEFPKVD